MYGRVNTLARFVITNLPAFVGVLVICFREQSFPSTHLVAVQRFYLAQNLVSFIGDLVLWCFISITLLRKNSIHTPKGDCSHFFKNAKIYFSVSVSECECECE